MSTVDYNPNEKKVRTYLDFTDEERRVFAKSVERRNFTHWSVSGERVYAHVYVCNSSNFITAAFDKEAAHRKASMLFLSYYEQGMYD